VQPFDASRLVVMLELFERRIEATERMTEEAVFRIGRARCGIRTYVMGTRIVRNHTRTACGIVPAARVWHGDSAGAETCDQQERDAATVDPRRSAKHQTQLSYWQRTRQQLADS